MNNEWGHAAGDEVLRALAETLLSGKRAVDQVGRLGGEEFGLLLPATPAAAAVTVVERIRQRLEAAPIRVVAPQAGVRVTLSAGVSEIETGGRRAGGCSAAGGRAAVSGQAGRAQPGGELRAGLH